MNNPLCDPIFQLLVDKKQFKINTLFDELQKRNLLKELDDCASKDLFKKNFLIMNALYQLQSQLQAERCHLRISTLHIELVQSSPDGLTSPEPLRDYYLDWTNYDTSLEAIEALLDSFWQHFAAPNSRTFCITDIEQCSALWSLPSNFTLSMLQKRWRTLALSYHPDRPDGHLETFQRLESEYQILRQFVANSSN